MSIDYNSPEYVQSLDNFLEGYRWLNDFKLFGFKFEMIFYIRPSDGKLDKKRTHMLYIHKKIKNKYQGYFLHV